MKRVFYQALALLLLAVSAVTTIAVVEQSELLPTVSFFPNEIYLDEQTRNFTVSVNVENLQASQKLVGIEMTLEYNSTLISFVEIIPGFFWRDFGDTVVMSDLPTIGILLLPPWTRFPEGNGTIAALSFEVGVLGDSEIRLTRLYVSTPESEIDVPIVPGLDPYVRVRRTWNRADLNADGKVDILDLSVLSKAFASRPGHNRWNTNVDIDRNQMIDIRDAVKIANNFGKHQ